MAFKAFEQSGPVSDVRRAADDGETIGAVFGVLFSFRGKATRLEYWMITLGLLLLWATIGVAMVHFEVRPEALEEVSSLTALLVVVQFVTWWIGLAATARRLRDRAFDTQLILCVLVGPLLVALVGAIVYPMLVALAVLINLWVLIECSFLPSRD